MESNQQTLIMSGSHIRQNTTSNVFTKHTQSRLYDSINLQPSTVYHKQVYDSQYRNGFPKLYSFDTVGQNKSRVSLDEKGKYSFRNDYSKIVEQNTLLIKQNTFLREEITKLTSIIQVERTNAGSRTEVERLNGILIQKDTEIRTLRERIFVLENQGSRTNERQVRFNQSQNIIAQLNAKIGSLTQQLSQYETQSSQFNVRVSQYETQINQLNLRISQYEGQINQLNVKINQYKTQINQLNVQINQYTTKINQLERMQRQAPAIKADSQVEQLKNQINSLTTKIEQYQLQISQYEKTFTQYETQITSLQQVNWKLEERIEKETVQARPKSQPKQVVAENEQWIFEQGKLNFRIIILLEELNRLKQKEQDLIIKAEQLHAYLLKAENYIEEIQLELQKNNLKENIPTYIVEKVTHLEEQNTKYSLLIEELQSRLSVTQISGVSEDQHYTQLGERQFRIIILMEEINRLNQKVIETRKYLENAENYIEQIQKTIEQRQTIIPPEVETQLAYLSEENHRLNTLIQNYIDEIKHLRVNVPAPVQTKIQYQVPAEIQTKVAFLAQQNERLQAYIKDLERRAPIQVPKIEYKVEYKVPTEVENRLAFLTQENERLFAVITELERRPPVQIPSAPVIEYKVPQQIQTKVAFLTQENEKLQKLILDIQNRPVVVSQPIYDNQKIQTDYAQAKFRIIILLQEINRLNHSLQEVTSYLVNAQNFIEQLQIRLHQQQTTVVQTNVQYVVPEQIEAELAKAALQRIVLLEQINRLNHLVKEIHSHLVNAENYIEECEIRMNEMSSTTKTIVQYQVPVEIQNKLAFLAQQNERLVLLLNEIQTRPAKVETRIQQRVQFKIPAEVERRIAQLTGEVQRLEKLLAQASAQNNEGAQIEMGKLTFRIIILLEEINRLNYVSEELRQNLITAENYIFDFENRQLQGAALGQLQNEIYSLRIENQNLHAELNRISLEYEQKISLYKTQISNINIQLSTFRSQATTYKSRFEQLERKSTISSASAQRQNELQSKWAAEHFRTIILLEEINRLNHKINVIDAERNEVISHLVNAENYISDMEIRLNLAEAGSKQQTFTNNTMIEGSNSAIIELNAQLMELQNRGRIEIAQKDLRVIFLLEQINRLNHKIKQLSVSGGSESNVLLEAKQAAERQLQQVLSHLRQAEEYIGQILRDNEGLAMERENLINELNRLTGGR